MGWNPATYPVCKPLWRWVTVMYFRQLRNYKSMLWGLCCLSPCYILSLWGSPFLVVEIVVTTFPRACSALLCNWYSDESSGHLLTCLLTIWSSLQLSDRENSCFPVGCCCYKGHRMSFSKYNFTLKTKKKDPIALKLGSSQLSKFNLSTALELTSQDKDFYPEGNGDNSKKV